MSEPTTYDDKILAAFKLACEKNGGPKEGASAHDVTTVMKEQCWLAAFDTVIDIADEMKRLRKEGRL